MRWLAAMLTPLVVIGGCSSPAPQRLTAVGDAYVAWSAGCDVRWMRVGGTGSAAVCSVSLPEPASRCTALRMGTEWAAAVAGVRRVYVIRQGETRVGARLSAAPAVVRDVCAADLDRDGWDEILILAGERASRRGTLRVYSLRRGRWLWQGLRPELCPWKVRAGDVDGDGSPDVVVAVWKKTRFDPVWDNRPFVYHWSKGGLHPSWLGSRLGKRFTDFELADVDGDGLHEIVTIGRARDGRCLSCFKRYGFGFSGEWAGPTRPDIQAISAAGSPATVVALERGSGWRLCAYRLSGGGARAEAITAVKAAPAFCALDGNRIAYVDRDRLHIIRLARGGSR